MVSKVNAWKIDKLVDGVIQYTDKSREDLLLEITESEEIFDTIVCVKDKRVMGHTRIHAPISGVIIIEL